MKVKKYMARSMPEAMQLVRKELGSDAVILNSREVRLGGFLGMFKTKKIEVIAAIDPQPIIEKESKKVIQPPQNLKTNDINVEKEDLNVLKEVKELKELFILQSKQNTQFQYELIYNKYYLKLLEQDVDGEIAKNLIDSAVQHFDGHPKEPTDLELRDFLLKELQAKLSVISFQPINYEKQVIQFVGPTGVGKTTTIAKIAAKSMLEDQKKVAFITADTYRIAAIEQLKTYAKILNVPLEVAYNNDDYQAALNKFNDYDLILVDTAGRNFRDQTYIREHQKNTAPNEQTEVHLVMSLTAKVTDMVQIYEQFQTIPVQSIIFTKIDETSVYGSLINIPLINNIGVSYVTNGQDVPDDLITPDAFLISQYIIGGMSDA